MRLTGLEDSKKWINQSIVLIILKGGLLLASEMCKMYTCLVFHRATLKQGTPVGYRGCRNEGSPGGSHGCQRFLLSKLGVGQSIALHAMPTDKTTAYSLPSR